MQLAIAQNEPELPRVAVFALMGKKEEEGGKVSRTKKNLREGHTHSLTLFMRAIDTSDVVMTISTFV